MITIYEIPGLVDNLKQLHKFFDARDTLGGVNNRHIPRLESKFASLSGKKAIAVNHCTNGLYLAFSKYKPTVVIIPPVVFFGVVGSVIQAGHTPYFAPVDITGNLDILQIDFSKFPDDCIIMNIHMNSRVVDLRNLDKVVIEDAASAYGSCYQDGSDLISATPHDAVISFSYGKPLTAGEGGMIFTNNNEQFYRTKRYCGLDELKGDYGIGTFDVLETNIKFPFNALGAGLLTLQLKTFANTLATRRSKSLQFDCLTQSFNQIKSYQLGNCLTYMMRFNSELNRNIAKEFLTLSGVQCYLNHKPAHMFTGLKKFSKHENVQDSCNDYYSRVLHVACRPMSQSDHEILCNALEQIPSVLN